MDLSAVFNWQNFFTFAIDVTLFAWMHFTTGGMAFGGEVAEFLGFIEGIDSAETFSTATDLATGVEGYGADM